MQEGEDKSKEGKLIGQWKRMAYKSGQAFPPYAQRHTLRFVSFSKWIVLWVACTPHLSP